MKFLIFIALFLPILFLANSCKNSPTEPNAKDTSSVIFYKPNLYIYPNETKTLSVKISFPKGGKILKSIPDYQNGWNVKVEPNGKIDDTYDYLFYECRTPNLTQKKYGWVIEKNKLNDFFTNNLVKSGFNQREISDFIKYWIPILKDYEYYEIYPQYKSTLDKMAKIIISQKPNNFYRLLYLIKGRNDKQIELLTPTFEKAKREKYFAIEWGVILK